MAFEGEAHDMEALVRTEEPPAAGRVTRWPRAATALGATAVLALGGKVAWHGVPISEQGVIGANGACSNNGESCSESLCCNDGNSNCFRKNAHWASCNQTCDSNMLWVENGWERQDEPQWECHQLSPADDGEDCAFSKQCNDPNSQCYRKNDEWASCNKSCSPNNLWEGGQWNEKEEPHWDCHILSATADGENCMESKTCKDHDSHCYEKNDHWASCNASCSENYLWVKDTGKWVEQPDKVWNCKILSCVADGTNCMDSRCCKSEGSTCFKKNDEWASCNATCSPKSVWSTSHNAWVEQADDLWDCSELLPEATDESADTTEPPEAETTEAPEEATRRRRRRRQ